MKSTLQNLPTYALSLFVIPAKFSERMEKSREIFSGLALKIIKDITWWLGTRFASPKALEG